MILLNSMNYQPFYILSHKYILISSLTINNKNFILSPSWRNTEIKDIENIFTILIYVVLLIARMFYLGCQACFRASIKPKYGNKVLEHLAYMSCGWENIQNNNWTGSQEFLCKIMSRINILVQPNKLSYKAQFQHRSYKLRFVEPCWTRCSVCKTKVHQIMPNQLVRSYWAGPTGNSTN